jgi:hypothetical protein
MKFLNLNSSHTTYKFFYRILKFSGFVFFTIKFSTSGMQFLQTFIDCLVFLLCFTINIILMFIKGPELALNLQSEILMNGAKSVMKVTYLATAFSRAIIFLGTKRAFEVFKNFERTDQKVREQMSSRIFKHRVNFFFRSNQRTSTQNLESSSYRQSLHS